MDEIIPRNPDVKSNLQRKAKVVVEAFRSSLTAKCLAKFKVKYGVPNQVELTHAGDDEVYTHRPGYCALFSYPFTISNSFPLPFLVEEFCRYYRVCPTRALDV